MSKYKGNTLWHFQGNNGYANVPQCYITRTLPTLLTLALDGAEILLNG
jgi:hypothetical protein